MFSNTLTLTINAVDKVLKRTNQDAFGSVYEFTAGDGSEYIAMKIRHSKEKNSSSLASKGVIVNRANVFFERIIFATPTTVERYYSVTATMRRRFDSSPDDLLKFEQGCNTLLLTLDDGLVVGEN
jgi:hypothetical protein